MKTAPRFTKEPWVLSITERYAYVRSAIGEYIMQYAFGTVSKAIKAERIANARLISAAPDLYAAQAMGSDKNTPDFLEWIADRLVMVYGEDPNTDFVLSLYGRAKAGRAAIQKATKEPT